jgi:Phage protein (N4 Gp49/phage Sf6 gene 66) family
MSEQQIEQQIQDKGLTAPRVTPADIEANIVAENYFDAFSASALGTAKYNKGHKDEHVDALRLLTFCILTLKNGFMVTGESVCASRENFDAEIGRKIARENARNKIWALEGYLLKEKLFQNS